MVLPTDQSRFDDVISRVPFLANVDQLDVEPLAGGLTNSNYLVTGGGEQVVVRIVGDNGPVLVGDRRIEEAAMRRAVGAGISPELVLFVQPEGHMVTKYLSEAEPLTPAKFASPEIIPRLAAQIKRVHELEPIDGMFDPYANIGQWLAVLDERGTPHPSRLSALLKRARGVEAHRLPMAVDDMVLCHNDAYHLNFLDDGELWLIDWEYAGMGDALYDVASVGYMLDSDGKDALLASYFGRVDEPLRSDLESLICVVLCWNVCWSLIQIDGGVRGFDYAAYAERFLDLVPPRHVDR